MQIDLHLHARAGVHTFLLPVFLPVILTGALSACGAKQPKIVEDRLCVANASTKVNVASGRMTNPALVANGSSFGVAWTRTQEVSNEQDIYFAPISVAGKPVAEVRLTNSKSSSTPTLIWTGSEYGLFWLGGLNRLLYFMRLDSSGQPIGAGVPISFGKINPLPVIASNGSGYGLAWSDSGSGNDDIFIGEVDGAGKWIGTPARATTSPNPETPLALVYNGTGYALAWMRTSGKVNDGGLCFNLFDKGGNPIGQEQRIVTTDVARAALSIVSSTKGYGLAWRSTETVPGILFSAFDQAGKEVVSKLSISNAALTTADSFSMTGLGNGFGLAWSIRKNASSSDVRFVEIEPLGVVHGQPVTVSDTAQGISPILAWSGEHYGLTWSDGIDLRFATIGCKN